MKLIIPFNVLLFLLLLLSMCATSIKEKVCKGDITVNSVNIHSFKGCTEITGKLQIVRETFTGNETIPKMDPSELEVFSTLREVNALNINGAYHPNFTDLHYFRNLETIPLRYFFEGLYIFNTSLKSFGLRSLRTIHFVHIINNDDLCFAEGIKWHKNIKSKFIIRVRSNKPKNDCVADGMVCHKGCSLKDGCWGPSVDDCLSCVMTMRPEETCVDSCSYPGMVYIGYRLCGKCDGHCNETCSKVDPSECKKCFKDGPYCHAKCPAMKYKMNDECLPCNERCALGCTGPEDFVGLGGCDTCNKSIENGENPKQIIRCLKASETCLEGYFSDLVSVMETAEGLKSMAGKVVCRKCHPKCKKCKGYGVQVSVCDICANFRSEVQCEDRCPTEYYTDNSTKRCLRCSPQCQGCWGPGLDQCESCKNFKVPIGDNITHEFNCSDSCPEDKPHRIYEDQGGPYCSNKRSAEEKDINVPAIVAGVLSCTFLIGVFVAVVVYQWRQRAKSKEKTAEMTMRMTGLKDDEPLKPSGVKPNLAQLKIVQEVELRKGSVLGYGAFGTVYKALWVPKGDNVKIPIAVKVLKEGTGANTNREFLEEAYIMASIVHPHLLKLLAVCMTSPMMLVSQLMPLGCLLDYVRSNKEKIGSKPLLNWCLQIAKGMAHLEEKRLVHRDLAARNVLVQTPGYVKITDFGLAKLLDIDEEAYQATGGKVAIKWLAPECIHHRRYTHRSDVWAFGVTVWELMTYGRRPYENIPVRDVPEMLEKGERLTQPSICTIEVYMTMVKCWMVDAESRPSFRELSEEFAKMARDPGRYLVIEGDSLMRLPTYTLQDEQELIRSMYVTTQGTEVIMDAEEYLRPMNPDVNGIEDCNRPTYLDVIGDDSEALEREGYLIPSPPVYDYAYTDLAAASIEADKDYKLSMKYLEPVMTPDIQECPMTSSGDEEQTTQYNKSQKNPSNNNETHHECNTDSV